MSAPGSRRATASTSASAGISPPESTYGPIEIDVRAEMVEDPLVEALEARREKRERRLGGELLDELLVELPSLRGERDDAVLGRSAVDGVERRGDDVDAQHHARARRRTGRRRPGPR